MPGQKRKMLTKPSVFLFFRWFFSVFFCFKKPNIMFFWGVLPKREILWGEMVYHSIARRLGSPRISKTARKLRGIKAKLFTKKRRPGRAVAGWLGFLLAGESVLLVGFFWFFGFYIVGFVVWVVFCVGVLFWFEFVFGLSLLVVCLAFFLVVFLCWVCEHVLQCFIPLEVLKRPSFWRVFAKGCVSLVLVFQCS